MALVLVVNGREETLPGVEAGVSLADAVVAMSLKADRVAVERNGEIVPRGQWGESLLLAGDRLEIVHFVGGGRA